MHINFVTINTDKQWNMSCSSQPIEVVTYVSEPRGTVMDYSYTGGKDRTDILTNPAAVERCSDWGCKCEVWKDICFTESHQQNRHVRRYPNLPDIEMKMYKYIVGKWTKRFVGDFQFNLIFRVLPEKARNELASFPTFLEIHHEVFS